MSDTEHVFDAALRGASRDQTKAMRHIVLSGRPGPAASGLIARTADHYHDDERWYRQWWRDITDLASLWPADQQPHPDQCDSLGTAAARAHLPLKRLEALNARPRDVLLSPMRSMIGRISAQGHSLCYERLLDDWRTLRSIRTGLDRRSAADRVRDQWLIDYHTTNTNTELLERPS